MFAQGGAGVVLAEQAALAQDRARPARRRCRKPPGSQGGMTLKPSAAPSSNQVWMLSAIFSGGAGNDPVAARAGEALHQLADGRFLAIDNVDN